MVKGVKYTSAIFDSSGYANAARNYIRAIINADIPITLNPVSFDRVKPNVGRDENVLNSLVNRNIEYSHNIIHLTPEFIPMFIEEGKYNISYCVWETTRLHPSWPKWLDMVDEIWTSSFFSKQVMETSGVTKPVKVVPHCLDLLVYESLGSSNLKEDIGIPSGHLIFGCVAQYNERKNLVGLVRSYLAAFDGVDDVVLVLKTYRDYGDDENNRLLTLMQNIKSSSTILRYPKVLLITDSLSNDNMLRLYNSFDVFVSLHRGESFGIPFLESMALGKPVMSTAFGGQTDYIDDNNGYLIKYQLTPVFNMSLFSPWYMSSDQMWAEPDLAHAVEVFRSIYDDWKSGGNDIKEKGIEALNTAGNFSLEKIGEKIMYRLRKFNKPPTFRKQPQTFSVGMIVYNESQMLQAALKPFLNIPNNILKEIVIVDGSPYGPSVDNTVDCIPENDSRIKVVSGFFPNKEIQRNEYLKYVTGDWLFVLDADELYYEADLNKLIALMNTLPYNIECIHFRHKHFWRDFEHVISDGHWNNILYRLNRYRKGYSYKKHDGLYNEVNFPIDQNKNAVYFEESLYCWHYGHALGEDKERYRYSLYAGRGDFGKMSKDSVTYFVDKFIDGWNSYRDVTDRNSIVRPFTGDHPLKMS